jgi:hypothetical protein
MKAAIQAAMPPPLQVADRVFDATKEEQSYILTHPEWRILEIRRRRS